MDGASNSKRVGIEIVLTTLEGYIIEQSFTLGFPTSNNESEYEAVLARGYHARGHCWPKGPSLYF